MPPPPPPPWQTSLKSRKKCKNHWQVEYHYALKERKLSKVPVIELNLMEQLRYQLSYPFGLKLKVNYNNDNICCSANVNKFDIDLQHCSLHIIHYTS